MGCLNGFSGIVAGGREALPGGWCREGGGGKAVSERLWREGPGEAGIKKSPKI
jgi:hypothetical protein